MPNPFFDSPKTRRLRRDLEDMKQLAKDSSIFSFEASGDAPDVYKISFDGRGLSDADTFTDHHDLTIQLGVEYPRMLPSVRWTSKIYHPNINGGSPCLGTFAMNPNVRLVDIVEILWDMARLSTYNPYGGYGEKDIWQVLRKRYDFPVDKRILRDKIPPPSPREEDGGEAELVIMGRSTLDGPASQVWAQTALEQFFESRGVAPLTQVLTADEWYAETKQEVPNLVGVVVMDKELWRGIKGMETPELGNLSREIGAFTKRLGVRPMSGSEPGLFYLISGRY